MIYTWIYMYACINIQTCIWGIFIHMGISYEGMYLCISYLIIDSVCARIRVHFWTLFGVMCIVCVYLCAHVYLSIYKCTCMDKYTTIYVYMRIQQGQRSYEAYTKFRDTYVMRADRGRGPNVSENFHFIGRCVHMRVCVCVCACKHVCVYLFVRDIDHTPMRHGGRVYTHNTQPYLFIRRFLRAYTRIYHSIHTYVHTYVHTHTLICT